MMAAGGGISKWFWVRNIPPAAPNPFTYENEYAADDEICEDISWTIKLNMDNVSNS